VVGAAGGVPLIDTFQEPVAAVCVGARRRVRLGNARRFSSDGDDGDVARLSIQQLLSNSLVNPRRHLDLDRVQRYTQLLDELPPITVFRLEDQTLLLVDGYHRVAAAQEAGRATVDAEIREGTRAEAVRFAAEVAVREGGFSDEQAREAIKRYSGGRRPA
jgi:ParB-like nuclease domain